MVLMKQGSRQHQPLSIGKIRYDVVGTYLSTSTALWIWIGGCSCSCWLLEAAGAGSCWCFISGVNPVT